MNERSAAMAPRVWDRLLLATAAVVTLAAAIVAGHSGGTEDGLLITQVRDVASGARGWPLLIHSGGEQWLQPLAVYPPALLVRMGISAPVAVRVTAATAGVLALVLTYLLARRAPLGDSLARWSVVLLLTAPAYLTHARTDGASLLLVALVLAWCVCVMEYAFTGVRWLPMVGGIALGLCGYTQAAGLLTAAIYYVCGALLLRRVQSGTRAAILAGLAMLVTLLPLGIWILRSPELYPDTLGRWAIHGAHLRSPIEGVIATTRWHVMARRVGAYWEYLSPTFLFATGQMFAVLSGFLLITGIWVIARRARTEFERLLLLGFFVAPIAGVLLDVDRRASYALMYLPFGAIVAAYGAEQMLGVPGRWPRVAGTALAAALFLELTILGR